MRNELSFPGGKKKAFTMSYDDGVEQDIRLIAIMQKYGVKGTFNLNSEAYRDEVRSYPEGTIHRRMGRKLAVETYADSGMEIAVHTYTHPFLDRVPRDMATYEVIKDRETLEALFGRIVRGMAYPMGTFSDMTVEVLESCGIAYSRTTVSTHGFDIPTDWLRMPATCHHDDPLALELAEKFVGEERPYGIPQLFYLWGHAYEFEANDNWEHIEKILDIVARRDDVWYATNIEIYDYVKAFEALRFSVDGSLVHNPTCTDVWFTRYGKPQFVAAGATVRVEE